jgi:hypothetical protein
MYLSHNTLLKEGRVTVQNQWLCVLNCLQDLTRPTTPTHNVLNVPLYKGLSYGSVLYL